jgi:hypothetical protein
MKTVYVVGAGASAEVGLPVGHKLKLEIAGLLNILFNDSNKQYKGDSHIHLALKELNKCDKRLIGVDSQDLLPLCWQVSQSLPLAISIDNYIDNHRDSPAFEVIGKLAILKAISVAESNSRIYFSKANAGFSANQIANTWYVSFFQSITENCSFEQVAERLKLITLIVFNYDRCVEHFLTEALKIYYGKDDLDVESLLANLTIIHPYGMMAKLADTSSPKGYKYGANLRSEDLVNCSDNIKTFTEGMQEDSTDFKQIQESMNDVQRLVFLGFAFHELNMKILKPLIPLTTKPIQCLATTYGMSDNDTAIVERIIKGLYATQHNSSRINFLSANKTCFDFFNHFRLSLRF